MRTFTAGLVIVCAACASPARKLAPAGSTPPATPASGAERVPADGLAADCAAARLHCRRDVRVVLRREKGPVYDQSWPIFPPALQPGFMTILPGETLLVEARLEGERVVLEKVVDRAEHPERTLEFSFRQVPGGTGMMLTIKNPLPQMVKYRAGMMMLDDPKDGAVYATSSCPVPPGLSAFESWPEPIFQLVLADFRVQQGSDLRCE